MNPAILHSRSKELDGESSEHLGPVLSFDKGLPSVHLDALGQDLLGRFDLLATVVYKVDRATRSMMAKMRTRLAIGRGREKVVGYERQVEVSVLDSQPKSENQPIISVISSPATDLNWSAGMG